MYLKQMIKYLKQMKSQFKAEIESITVVESADEDGNIKELLKVKLKGGDING